MEPPSSVGLFDVAVSDKPPPQASELSLGLRKFASEQAFLHMIPGNFDLIKYSIVTNKEKLERAKTRFLRFISQAKEEYDLIVIDCNPSSSFITLCALHACSYLLVPVRPDRYSVLGLELVADLLDRIPTIHPKPEILIVLNGIPRQHYNRSIEDELRSHDTFGQLVLTKKLRTSRLLEASPGYTGFATDKPVPYRELLKTEISEIAQELGQRLGFVQ